MKYWKIPPAIKIYEALGAIVDKRIEVKSNNHAVVWSSTRNKYYDVRISDDGRAIMANDNGSYYQEYLGYPAIAFLMVQKRLPFDETLAHLLRDIPWKDLNQKYQNDFNQVIEVITSPLTLQDRDKLKEFCLTVFNNIERLPLELFGEKELPPAGY